MPKNLSFDKHCRPELEASSDRNAMFNRSLRLLSLKLGQKGKPCYSRNEMSTAYWATKPNDNKEVGVIVLCELDDVGTQPNIFIGTTDITESYDLKKRATAVAEFSAPRMDIAILGLATFLYPELLDRSDRFKVSFDD